MLQQLALLTGDLQVVQAGVAQTQSGWTQSFEWTLEHVPGADLELSEGLLAELK